jgi:hypothetical protein
MPTSVTIALTLAHFEDADRSTIMREYRPTERGTALHSDDQRLGGRGAWISLALVHFRSRRGC